MFARACVVAAVATLSISCSATGAVDCEGNFVYSPDTFTAEQQTWIEESSLRWNTWVGHRVTSVRPGYADVCFVDNGPTPDQSKVGNESNRLRNIIIDVEGLRRRHLLDKARFESVAMHEMGHALGYGHITTGPALMAPSATLDFTELDRQACIAHGMCPAQSSPKGSLRAEEVHDALSTSDRRPRCETMQEVR